MLSLAMGFSFRRALGHGFRGELKNSKTHTPIGSRAFPLTGNGSEVIFMGGTRVLDAYSLCVEVKLGQPLRISVGAVFYVNEN